MIYAFDPANILERDDKNRIIIHKRYDKGDYSVGSIHSTNNCGLYRVLSYEGRNDNNKKIYKIEFLKSKNVKIVTKSCMDTGKIKDDKIAESYYIGKKYKSNKCGVYTIIEYAGHKKSYMMFKVRFDDTGYETISKIGNITRGKVRDPLHPTECAIGYLGEEYRDLRKNDKELYDLLYSRWRDMLQRCYYKTNCKYHIYGQRGIKVHEDWHNLSNFIKDAQKLPGFDRQLIIDGILQIDKDKLQLGKDSSEKIYSKDTCCWLTPKDQSKYIDHLKASSNQCIEIECIKPDGTISIEPSI